MPELGSWSESGSRESRVIELVGVDETRRESDQVERFQEALKRPVVEKDSSLRQQVQRFMEHAPILRGVALLAAFLALALATRKPGHVPGSSNLQALWVILGALAASVVVWVLFAKAGSLGAALSGARTSAPPSLASYHTSYRLTLGPDTLRLSWPGNQLELPLTEVVQLEGSRRLVVVRADGTRTVLPCSLASVEGGTTRNGELAARCTEIIGELRMLHGYRGGSVLDEADARRVRGPESG